MVTDCGIYPNQVLTQIKIQPKLQKRERRLCDIKFKKYNIKTYIKKKPSTLIRVIRKNKNPSRERERERALTVFSQEKYGLNERNDIEFIQK